MSTVPNLSKEELLRPIKQAFAPFPELQRLFKDKLNRLSERQLRLIPSWLKEGKMLIDERSPHLILLWATLPVTPNPLLKALHENIVLLQYAGVKGEDKKRPR